MGDRGGSSPFIRTDKKKVLDFQGLFSFYRGVSIVAVGTLYTIQSGNFVNFSKIITFLEIAEVRKKFLLCKHRLDVVGMNMFFESKGFILHSLIAII